MKCQKIAILCMPLLLTSCFMLSDSRNAELFGSSSATSSSAQSSSGKSQSTSTKSTSTKSTSTTTSATSSSKQTTSGPIHRDGFIFENGSVRVEDASKLSGWITIPDEAPDGTPVTSIPANGFKNCANVTEFVIPDSVTSIGSAAFAGCGSLIAITLPFIGGEASSTLINPMRNFGYIFGTSSFTGSTRVKSYYSEAGSSTNFYVPSSLGRISLTNATSVGIGAFSGLTMVNTLEFVKPLTDLSLYCFQGMVNLQRINLPSAKTIPQFAFDGCTALENVSFGDITSIGKQAFRNCTSLAYVNSATFGQFIIPESVQTIGEAAFANCALIRKMTLPFVGLSRSSTGASALFGAIFGSASYSTMTSVQQLYSSTVSKTFYVPTFLSTVIITDADNVCGYGAFQNMTMLTGLKINSRASSDVGAKAFYNCVTPTWDSDDGWTASGKLLFKGNKVKALNTSITGDIEIPTTFGGDTIDTIGTDAFKDCSEITSITMGDTITSIASGAFSGCYKLASIVIPFVGISSSATYENGHFGQIFGTTSYQGSTKISSSNGSIKTDYYLPAGLNEVAVIDGTKLVIGAFHDVNMVTALSFQDGPTTVPNYCFWGMRSLTSISLPDAMSLGVSAFRDCEDLSSISCPNITFIGTFCFSGCLSLARFNDSTHGRFVIPNAVTYIGPASFAECAAMEYLVLPYIGCRRDSLAPQNQFGIIFDSFAYEGGVKLVQNWYSDGSAINQFAYYVPTNLKTVYVRNATTIADYAFENVTSLDDITINSGANVGSKAFYNCTVPISYVVAIG